MELDSGDATTVVLEEGVFWRVRNSSGIRTVKTERNGEWPGTLSEREECEHLCTDGVSVVHSRLLSGVQNAQPVLVGATLGVRAVFQPQTSLSKLSPHRCASQFVWMWVEYW